MSIYKGNSKINRVIYFDNDNISHSFSKIYKGDNLVWQGIYYPVIKIRRASTVTNSSQLTVKVNRSGSDIVIYSGGSIPTSYQNIYTNTTLPPLNLKISFYSTLSVTLKKFYLCFMNISGTPEVQMSGSNKTYTLTYSNTNYLKNVTSDLNLEVRYK